MRKIAIVVDSTCLLSEAMKNNPDVYSAPLSVIVNEQEYKDLIDLNEADWIRFLSEDSTMTTSQPQTSVVVDLLSEVKEKSYDFVYILSITSQLSGTLNSFNIGINMTQLTNYELIDTYTIAGPVGYMAEAIWEMNELGLDHETIMDHLQNPLHHNETLISPETLNRLVKSGRMSKTTGLLGSLLKLKPVLKFSHHDESIDKHEVVRSERKVYETIIKRLQDEGINAQNYIIYLLNVNAKDRVESFEAKLLEAFPNIEVRHEMLPGVIATHVGIGTLGVQFVKKVQL